jgi:TonB family protein
MKTLFSLAIAFVMALNVNAQKINIVGTWNEVDPNQYHNQVLDESIVVRKWIFSADGTKTLKGRMQLTYPIGGINCTFDMIQSRTDEKWTLNGKTLTMVAIPLNKLTIDVDYQKYGNYTAAQKQKINASIPAFKQQAIKETRQGWQSFVGHTSIYTISSYNPKQMVLDLDGQKFVLVRDLSKMTPAQKAEIEKEMQEFISQENSKEDNEDKEETREEPTQTTDDLNEVFDVCEEMPQFPGGPQALFEYLSKNLKYPAAAEKNGVQGRVIANFVVERDGSISNVNVTKSVDPLIDNEAIRLLQSMPRWTPGKQKGKEVRVKYTVPVTFRLQ